MFTQVIFLCEQYKFSVERNAAGKQTDVEAKDRKEGNNEGKEEEELRTCWGEEGGEEWRSNELNG